MIVHGITINIRRQDFLLNIQSSVAHGARVAQKYHSDNGKVKVTPKYQIVEKPVKSMHE